MNIINALRTGATWGMLTAFALLAQPSRGDSAISPATGTYGTAGTAAVSQEEPVGFAATGISPGGAKTTSAPEPDLIEQASKPEEVMPSGIIAERVAGIASGQAADEDRTAAPTPAATGLTQ